MNVINQICIKFFTLLSCGVRPFQFLCANRSFSPGQTLLLVMFILSVNGCKSISYSDLSNDNIVVGSKQVSETLSSNKVFHGVCIFLNDMEGGTSNTITAVEGEDLQVNYFVGLFMPKGAFVLSDEPIITVSTPGGKAWKVKNTSGVTIGSLYSERDDPLNELRIAYSNDRSRRWEYIPGHQGNAAIDANTPIDSILIPQTINVPFGEIDPTGKWGKVPLRLSASFIYFDIAEQHFVIVNKAWPLFIDFTQSDTQME